MKGKVDIFWYGHCGFMIQFKDKDDVQRCIYIDLLVNNPDCPKEFKDNPLPPNDVDLCLITNGKQ